jgi:lipooligosaccharide transport system permease protein
MAAVAVPPPSPDLPAAPPGRSPVVVRGAARAGWRVVEREAHVFRRLWWGFVFSYFLGPLLFLGAMGIGLGGLVTQAGGTVDGLSYLQFVAPGLLAATLVQSAAADSLWPVLGGLKWDRRFHAMAATPLRPADAFVGNLEWLGLRLVLSGAVFLVVALVLGALVSPWAVLAVPFGVLGGLAFAAPLAAFSATQDTEGRFPLILRFGVQPLFLFSGTFFPVSQLPGWMQPLVWLSPLWHAVALCRAATTGGWGELGAPMIAAHLAVLLAVTAAGMWAGIRAFSHRIAA